MEIVWISGFQNVQSNFGSFAKLFYEGSIKISVLLSLYVTFQKFILIGFTQGLAAECLLVLLLQKCYASYV